MWLWGIVGESETTSQFAKRVFEYCDARFPPARDKDGKQMEQLWLDYCDPHIDTSSKTGTTDPDELEDAWRKWYKKPRDMPMPLTWVRLSFEKGITLVRERLELRNDGEPGLLIDDEFHLAKDGALGGYHFPDDRKSGAQPEYPADDGTYIHLFDALNN